MFKERSESLDKRIPPSIEAPIKNTLEMCFLALNIETSGKSTSCIGYKNPSPLPCMGLDDVAVSSSLRLFAFKSSKVGLVMEDSLFVAVGAWIATVPTLTPLVGFFKCPINYGQNHYARLHQEPQGYFALVCWPSI